MQVFSYLQIKSVIHIHLILLFIGYYYTYENKQRIHNMHTRCNFPLINNTVNMYISNSL